MSKFKVTPSEGGDFYIERIDHEGTVGLGYVSCSEALELAIELMKQFQPILKMAETIPDSEPVAKDAHPVDSASTNQVEEIIKIEKKRGRPKKNHKGETLLKKDKDFRTSWES